MKSVKITWKLREQQEKRPERKVVPEPVEEITEKTAYYQIVNDHSVGDSIGLLSYDLVAQMNDIDLYWLIHMDEAGQLPPPNLNNGWFHFELFRLYHEAGFYQKPILVPSINMHNHHDGEANIRMLSYVERVYGRSYDRLRPSALPELTEVASGPIYMPMEMKRRFKFLDGKLAHLKPYLVVQAASTYTTNGRFIGNQMSNLNRASYPKIMEAVERYLPNIKNIVFVGNGIGDDMVAETFGIKMGGQLNVGIVNLAGRTTIREYFGILYNCSGLVCGQTNSAFFTSQLGIPSVQIFTLTDVATSLMKSFIKYYRRVACLTIEPDSWDVYKDPTDLF